MNIIPNYMYLNSLVILKHVLLLLAILIVLEQKSESYLCGNKSVTACQSDPRAILEGI